jgi:hypothetical protein
MIAQSVSIRARKSKNRPAISIQTISAGGLPAAAAGVGPARHFGGSGTERSRFSRKIDGPKIDGPMTGLTHDVARRRRFWAPEGANYSAIAPSSRHSAGAR